MKSQLQQWGRLLQDLHDEVESQQLKNQIKQVLSEIEKILSEWVDEEKPPPKKVIKKAGVKVSDVLYKGMIKLAEHEMLSIVLEKIHHLF